MSYSTYWDMPVIAFVGACILTLKAAHTATLAATLCPVVATTATTVVQLSRCVCGCVCVCVCVSKHCALFWCQIGLGCLAVNQGATLPSVLFTAPSIDLQCHLILHIWLLVRVVLACLSLIRLMASNSYHLACICLMAIACMSRTGCCMWRIHSCGLLTW